MNEEERMVLIRKGEEAIKLINSIRTTKDLKNSSKDVLFYVNKKVQEIIKTGDTSKINQLINLIKEEFPVGSGSIPSINPADPPHLMGLKTLTFSLPKIFQLLKIFYTMKKLG